MGGPPRPGMLALSKLEPMSRDAEVSRMGEWARRGAEKVRGGRRVRLCDSSGSISRMTGGLMTRGGPMSTKRGGSEVCGPSNPKRSNNGRSITTRSKGRSKTTDERSRGRSMMSERRRLRSSNASTRSVSGTINGAARSASRSRSMFLRFSVASSRRPSCNLRMVSRAVSSSSARFSILRVRICLFSSASRRLSSLSLSRCSIRRRSAWAPSSLPFLSSTSRTRYLALSSMPTLCRRSSSEACAVRANSASSSRVRVSISLRRAS
mmetsp:Transcript_66273/g.156516  ORF Transcript_66273/g.156516 Transcript_66273/m.156516 type:complete len:265 (+) Transcript_66273:81-875(+)